MTRESTRGTDGSAIAEEGRRVALNGRFTIIGENIHTTRVLLRSGRHVQADGGAEWLVFEDVEGVIRRLPVPEWHKETQEHESGRLKHVGIAVRTAMAGGPE